MISREFSDRHRHIRQGLLVIRTGALGKGFGAAALLAAIALGVAAVLFLTAQGGEPPTPIVLDGVLPADFILVSPPPDAAPAVSEAEAVEVALRDHYGGVVRQTVLVSLSMRGGEPPFDTLAWAVNFDPATVGGEPPHISGTEQVKPEDYALDYLVVFVDAKTGDWLFEGERSHWVNPPPLPTSEGLPAP